MSTLAQLDLASRLASIIEATVKVPSERIGIDADLETLGINSLILMELIENIDKEFSVTLTPAQLAGVTSVGALAEAIAKLQAGSPQPQSQEETSSDLLSYVSEKYAVDLSHRTFSSIDEIADALVSDHSAALMRYYGLQPDRAAEEKPALAPRSSDIAIVGMSCRLADAPDLPAFWKNLLEARNSVREVPESRWRWAEHFAEIPTPGKSVSKWGALIADVDRFDAGFFGIAAAEARAMDPQQRLLLQETYRAVEDAGLDIRRLAGTRTGVFVGYQYSEYEHHLRARNNQRLEEGPLFSSSSPSYYLANRISFQFDFRGPSESINMQCASSAVAINRAYYSLLDGESDVAIAGGVSLNLFAGDYIASSQYRLLSANGTSGVFDNEASGFTRGEGVALIVLKRLADARRDNDRIYGVIKACHHTYRGAARNISEVRHEAFTSVLSECYRKAAIEPQTVRYIEVDGYATKWADSIEYEGIKNTFGRHPAGGKYCALGSVKGNIGNVEPASGVTGVIKLALALHHKTFPATISKKNLSTFIDIDDSSHPLYIADEAIPFEAIRQGTTPIRAGVNSFADSGTNVHILLEEHLPQARPPSEAVPSRQQLCVLSAKDAQRLAAQVRNYIDRLSAADEADSFHDLVYTMQTGRESLNERLAIVAASRAELLEKLSVVHRSGLRAANLASQGIYHGSDKNSLARLITPQMVRMQLEQSVQTGQWQQIALLWVNGVTIPWDALWEGRAVRRASLPGYPFAADRHWIDAGPAGAGEPLVQLEEHAPAASRFDAAAGSSASSRVEQIQRFLLQEVAQQLRRPADEIALDATLVELGMSSVGIGGLINKLDELLHTHLSPGVMFRYPQISTLAAYLAQTYPEALETPAVCEAEQVVAVQTRGTQAPLFAVPGAGANALSLQQLSKALGDEQPFYCLEPLGLDGKASPGIDVVAVAELHLKGVKSIQSKGPYRLLGYSNGGVVAFEMARQLLQRRERVASLILLDTLCPTLRHEPLEEMMVAVFKHFVRTLGGVSDLDVKRLQQVPERERSEYLYESLRRLGIELPRERFLATFDVAAASERGCRAYLPTRLAHKIDVTLFRATDGYEDMPDDYGWQAFLAAPLRVCAVEADHFSVVERDAVREVARTIRSFGSKSARKAASDGVRQARVHAV